MGPEDLAVLAGARLYDVLLGVAVLTLDVARELALGALETRCVEVALDALDAVDAVVRVAVRTAGDVIVDRISDLGAAELRVCMPVLGDGPLFDPFTLTAPTSTLVEMLTCFCNCGAAGFATGAGGNGRTVVGNETRSFRKLLADSAKILPVGKFGAEVCGICGISSTGTCRIKLSNPGYIPSSLLNLLSSFTTSLPSGLLSISPHATLELMNSSIPVSDRVLFDSSSPLIELEYLNDASAISSVTELIKLK